jgi:hypothetical protein
MHAAGVFGQAVANFDVYLERAGEAVLAGRGATLGAPGGGRDLAGVLDELGVSIESEAVLGIRELRRCLTHQRGELRTEAQRARFASAGAPRFLVELGEGDVLGAMDQLGEAVRSVDPVVWARTVAGRPVAPNRGG